MQENIHDTQAKIMEWVVQDDIEKCAIAHFKRNTEEAKTEMLFAIAKCRQQASNSPHSMRLRGIAQGMMRTCLLCEVISKEEYNYLSNMLPKR